MANDPNRPDHAAPDDPIVWPPQQPDSSVPAKPGAPVSRPWQRAARTVFQGAVAVAVMWPTVTEAAGVDSGGTIAAGSIALAAGISRVMALPAVNGWLARYVPFLAA